jgi:hypothetical protein
MEDLDLNIQNYDLEDILNVFKLNYQFTESDLKQAYRTVLKTHPDKSGLDKEVFLFFKQAYNVLSKIYYFRNRKKECAHQKDYSVDIDTEKALLLKKLDGQSVKDFNKWFNDMFEKTKVSDDSVDKGYGNWYKNGEVEKSKNISMSDMASEFEKKKNQCKALVVKKDLLEMGGNSGYNLSRDAPEEYSSDIFSKLRYEDLKKAHTETVVPVTREDFEKTKKFKSVESYKRHRAAQLSAPPSLQQSRAFLKKKETQTNEIETRRIYSILKRDEEVAKSNEAWWGHLKQLGN